MPILFIDSTGDPALETWIGGLFMAAALSVSPKGAGLNEDDVTRILQEEFPGLLRMWGPVRGIEGEKLHAAE
jgi:hypothetical protein